MISTTVHVARSGTDEDGSAFGSYSAMRASAGAWGGAEYEFNIHGEPRWPPRRSGRCLFDRAPTISPLVHISSTGRHIVNDGHVSVKILVARPVGTAVVLS